jgi:hypothetical protein
MKTPDQINMEIIALTSEIESRYAPRKHNSIWKL